MLSEAEITAGLALHLDPHTLEQGGGTFTCPSTFACREGTSSCASRWATVKVGGCRCTPTMVSGAWN